MGSSRRVIAVEVRASAVLEELVVETTAVGGADVATDVAVVQEAGEGDASRLGYLECKELHTKPVGYART